MSERIVDPSMTADEPALEYALRPANLTEFIGQQRVRDQISVLLTAAQSRGSTADHILFQVLLDWVKQPSP